MKVLEFDERHGIMRLHVDDEDDLWVLHLILRKGDKVVARTSRDVGLGAESRRISMIIELLVEKTEFQAYTSRLRIHGIIEDAPERYGIKGSHHTINLDVGDEILIIKEKWGKFELDRIYKQAQKHNKVLVALVDLDEYLIAIPMEQGIKVLEEKSLRIGSKEENILEENAKEISDSIKAYLQSYNPEVIIVAGPGIFKEMVVKQLSNLKLKIYTDSVSSATISGLSELMHRDIITKVVRDYEIAEGTKIMEVIMENLAKDSGLVAYGKEEVKNAELLGAIEYLLVSEDLFEVDEEKRMEIEEVMESVEKKNGKVFIIPKDSPIYYQVKNLSGVVALLRFRIR